MMDQRPENRRYDGIRLGGLLGLLLSGNGFLGLPATVGTLLLRLVVGMRFFVVVAAFAAEEEQNLLRVAFAAHTPSVRSWRTIVKRTTMAVPHA